MRESISTPEVVGGSSDCWVLDWSAAEVGADVVVGGDKVVVVLEDGSSLFESGSGNTVVASSGTTASAAVVVELCDVLTSGASVTSSIGTDVTSSGCCVLERDSSGTGDTVSMGGRSVSVSFSYST